MSVELTEKVWEYFPFQGADLLVGVQLAGFAQPNGTRVFPSVNTLARRTRLSVRQVQLSLAKMRKFTWILVVAYPTGGRGKATEYAVNPNWIENPEAFAPFDGVYKNRVKFDPKKDARMLEKGCKAFAPQQKLEQQSQQQPAIEAPAQKIEATPIESVVVVDCVKELVFPIVLQGELQATFVDGASKVLLDCPPELRQPILDEVAAFADRKKITASPLSLLRALVGRAKQGTFQINLGTRVAAARNFMRAKDTFGGADSSSSSISPAAQQALNQEKIEEIYRDNPALRKGKRQ